MSERLEENQSTGKLERVKIQEARVVKEALDVVQAKEEARKLIEQRDNVIANYKTTLQELDALILPALSYIDAPSPHKIPTLEEYNVLMPCPQK
jgi:D-mannonate dehydratase